MVGHIDLIIYYPFSFQCHLLFTFFFGILQNILLVFISFYFIGKLQFNQTSLLPPLPHILINQSNQEMIMTHCLSDTVSPDVSDVTSLLV